MNATPSSALRISPTAPSEASRVSPAAASHDLAVPRMARHGNWPAPGQHDPVSGRQDPVPGRQDPVPGHQDDTAPRAGSVGRRALVLGGGGAAGNAWEIGLIAGLADAGIDVTRADLIVGTSAGSTAGAQITSGTQPAELYAAILAEVPQPQAGNPGNPSNPDNSGNPGNPGNPGNAGNAGPGAGRAVNLSGPAAMQWSQAIIDSARNASDMRRRMGAAALDRDDSDGSGQARRRDIVAARLPSTQWPQQRLLITAVDAQTGEPAVFDRDSGIDLVDAVAASTTHGFGPFPPYRIGERRYLDGGYRRNENADLAAGYARVLVLSPFSGRSRMPKEWGMDLATQVGELRAAGSSVGTVFPDSGAGDVFGANALDPATRRQAARGGYDQGRALAERLADMWR